MNIFGFEIQRAKKEPSSFTQEIKDDGAITLSTGGVYGTYVDMDGSVRNEAELVNKYREMSEHPDVDIAIDDIVNDAIVQEEEQKTVKLNINDLDFEKYPVSVKDAILKEFDRVLELLEFNDMSYEIFKRWYVDGRLYYHVIIDENDTSNGIQELRYIDPRKIRKIRETEESRTPSGVTLIKTKDEYFAYNENGFAKNSVSVVNAPSTSIKALKISKDSILHCTSGLTSTEGSLVLSYLNKAIKPLNQLRSMEDALVIYRLSRAPERRIFYIDVGNLPKAKAEQYLRDSMNRFKNKLVYDAKSGEIRDDRKFMTMLEDFWLPRRGEGRGTEITTLPGGQNLGQMDDVLYFQKNLYRALNVPPSRIDSESNFSFGRNGEITRDEIKFSKFITRLRSKFSQLFLRALERQLILKNIIHEDDWEEIRQNIRVQYATDNYYSELKETEILRDRISILRDMDDYIGRYYSHKTIRTIILKQTDQDIQREDGLIEEEKDDPKYAPPEAEMGSENDQQDQDQEQINNKE